ncbi:MAG: glycosyltransferase family 4 protein, partial [Actinobacteria bacterium]
MVGLGGADDVLGGRGLQSALVPQRHRLAARQLADRLGSRALRALAGGAQDRAADADGRGSLRLPAAGGLRRDAPLADAVPDRLPDCGAAAGVGGRRAGPARPGAARPPAEPAPPRSGDVGAAGDPLLGGRVHAALRRPRLRARLGRAPRAGHRRGGGAVRIAVLAPAWFAVPPRGYGGIEWVVSLLADGLADAGHDVTLFASGDSRTKAKLEAVFADPPSERIGKSLPELRHALACYGRADEFDVINDHSGQVAALAGGLVETPVVHTLHGPLDGEPGEVYERIAHLARRVGFISISLNQRKPKPDLPWIANCPNALDFSLYPCKPHRGDYLLFLGRMSADKGAHRAIAVARETGLPLKLAGKKQDAKEIEYFAEYVEPHLVGGIEYLGEVSHGQKVELLQDARVTL